MRELGRNLTGMSEQCLTSTTEKSIRPMTIS